METSGTREARNGERIAKKLRLWSDYKVIYEGRGGRIFAWRKMKARMDGERNSNTWKITAADTRTVKDCEKPCTADEE